MSKKHKREARWRDLPTDAVIVEILVREKGEMLRRELARKIAHRFDFGAALARLSRSGVIELIEKNIPGRRALSVVRLIGKEAERAGVGFQRMGVKS